MKRLLMKILLAVMGITFCITLSGAPMIAYAEESVEMAEDSVISTETGNESSEFETDENEGVIGAETEEETPVDETETSLWFDEVLKPMLIRFGAGVAALGITMLLCFKDFNKMKGILTTALSAVLKANEDNENMQKGVAEFETQFEAEFEEFKSEIRNAVEEIKRDFSNAIEDLKNGLGVKVADIDEAAHKLLEVEKIAYGDNAKLVSSGAAKRIAEVVDYGKNKNKK
jgi:hypothetical protein